MQFMKQVEPKFCSPRKPIVVCGPIILRLRIRCNAATSFGVGNQVVNGALRPNDLK